MVNLKRSRHRLMRTGPLGIFMFLLSLSFTFTFLWNQLQNKLVDLLSENWPTWHFQTCWFHSSPPVTCSWEASGLSWVWHQTSSKVLFPSLSVRLALFFCRIVLDLVEFFTKRMLWWTFEVWWCLSSWWISRETYQAKKQWWQFWRQSPV